MLATLPAASNAAASNAAATLLAIVVSANGRIDAREVAELDRLRAWARLDIARDSFMSLAGAALQEVGLPLSRSHGLRLSDRLLLLALQDAVDDPGQRLLVCRFSAAVITADGRVTADERLVHGALLSHWRVSDTMVAHAIMCDRGG